MEIIRTKTNIDFLGKRKLFITLSAVLVLASIIGFFLPGIRYGVDFAGGTVVQLRFQKPVRIDDLRSALEKILPGSPSVQNFGGDREFVIQMEQSPEKDLEGAAKEIRNSLASSLGDPNVEVRRVEMVGPKVGKDLRTKGVQATAIALGLILLYVWWRFEFYYSLGGVVALFHDCIVTVGMFILFRKDFDLTGLAAVLTIAGFSINDTIVIFDRVRENLKKTGGKGDLEQLMNRSLNETLSRTILTNGTVLFVVLGLFLFGGPVINNFAFAMLIGSIAGTYSTVYVASPIALFFERWIRTRRPARAAA